jgi:hypothetical protein
VRAFTFWDRALNPVRSYRSIGVRPPLSRCLLVRSTLAGAYTDSTHQGPRVRYAHTYSCLNVSTNTGTSRSSCSPGAQLRCNSTTDRRTVRKMHQLEFGEPHRNEPASKKGAGTNTPANSRTTRNQGRGKPRPFLISMCWSVLLRQLKLSQSRDRIDLGPSSSPHPYPRALPVRFTPPLKQY